jgi:Flp pilus assembly protein TadB
VNPTRSANNTETRRRSATRGAFSVGATAASNASSSVNATAARTLSRRQNQSVQPRKRAAKTAAAAGNEIQKAAAGIAAALIAEVVAIAWKPPNIVSFGVAWLCSIYALTVWTTPRLFALGATVIALPTLVAVAV